jgi:hypothetical protein
VIGRGLGEKVVVGQEVNDDDAAASGVGTAEGDAPGWLGGGDAGQGEEEEGDRPTNAEYLDI